MCDKRTLNRDKINKLRRRQRQIVKAMARDLDMQVTSDETSTNVSEDETHEPRECKDHSDTSAEHPEPSIIVGQEESNSTDDMTEEQEDENSIRESSTEEKYEEIRSHTSESTDEEEERNIYQELREWAIESNIPQKNLDKLLDILRAKLPELPKSAKTFLKTNSCTYDIRETESGQFVYFGLESGLRACIIEALHPENQIFLQVNVDGMSVFKSSSKQFWPILCKVHCPQMDVYTPFIVGCYCGDSKPHDLADYFHEFIYEINLLQKDGIILHAKRFKVYLKCFICDSPARALLKNVKGHGGFSACERCTVVGERVRKGKGFCTIYPDVDKQPRTNESFRKFDDPNHHNGISPLLDILPPIDMIALFLLDKLHLFDGGAMKKLMDDWHSGDLRVRLGRRSKLELNRRIASIKYQIPLEFQRKPRSTIYVAKWKCTEFRLFLLYIGPIILKNILQENLHFLSIFFCYMWLLAFSALMILRLNIISMLKYI